MNLSDNKEELFINPYELDAEEKQLQEQEGYYDEDLQEYYQLRGEEGF